MRNFEQIQKLKNKRILMFSLESFIFWLGSRLNGVKSFSKSSWHDLCNCFKWNKFECHSLGSTFTKYLTLTYFGAKQRVDFWKIFWCTFQFKDMNGWWRIRLLMIFHFACLILCSSHVWQKSKLTRWISIMDVHDCILHLHLLCHFPSNLQRRLWQS